MWLNRLLSLMLKDWRVSLRDRLALYCLLGPVLMCLIARGLLPGLGPDRPVFYVHHEIPKDTQLRLERLGQVHRTQDHSPSTEAAVRDPQPGVGYQRDHSILIEGDEPPAWVRLTQDVALLAKAEREAQPSDLDVSTESLGREPIPVYRMVCAALLYNAAVICGALIAFSIVQDREHNTLAVHSVSPASFEQYAAAKAAMVHDVALLAGLVNGLILLGLDGRLGWVLLAAWASVPTAWLFGFVSGLLSRDQISAVAVLKATLLIFGTLPLLALIDLGRWGGALWPFCGYWAMKAMLGATLTDRPVLLPAALAVLTAIPPLTVVLWISRRRLGW